MSTPVDDEVLADKIAAARSRMAELATKFISRSVGDVASLRAGLVKLTAGDVQALTDIRHLAHRMSGTGATLGFDRLGEWARELERLADRQARDTPPDAASIGRFEAALHGLEDELNALAIAKPV